MEAFKREEFAKADVLDNILLPMDKLLRKFDEADEKTLKWAKSMRELMSSSDPKTLSGLNAILSAGDQINKQTQQTILLEKEKVKVEQLSEKVKLAQVQLLNKQATEENRLAREQSNRAKSVKSLSVAEHQLMLQQKEALAKTKAIAQLRNAEKGSLQALEAKMKLVEMAYHKLTPEQIENTKQGQRYLKSLSAIRLELTASKMAYGNHSMVVGQYANKYNGLGNSISQIAREMPAFANSVQTGFMAISNNLPIFFDEIQKIRQANQQLAAEGKPTTSILKQIASNLVSPMMALNAFVILLTTASPALFKWIGSLDFASEAEKRHTEEIKKKTAQQKYANEEARKSREFIGRESTELVGQLEALKATNAGSKERLNMIKQINDQYGTTLKNLSDEAAFQEQVNALVFEYIEYQRQRYRIQRNEEKITLNLEKQEKYITKIKTELGLTQKQVDQLSKTKGWGNLYEQLTGIYTNTASIAEATGLSEKEAQKLLIAYKKLGEQDKVNAAFNEKELERRNTLWNDITGSEDEFTEKTTDMQKQIEASMIGLSDANDRLEYYGFEIADASRKTVGFTKAAKGAKESLKEFNVELSKFDVILANIQNYETEIQLRFDIQTIAGESNLSTLDRIIEGMKKQMLKDVSETGLLYTDEIDKLINDEFDIRKKGIENQTDFEIDSLKQKLADESAIRLRDIDNERDEKAKELDETEKQLFAEGKLTKNQRAVINKARIDLDRNYRNERKKISDDIAEQERLLGIKIKKLEDERAQKLTDNENQRKDKIIQVNDELIEAQKDYYDKDNENKRKAREDALKKEKEQEEKMQDWRSRLIEKGIDELKKASQEREKLIDKEIQASEKLTESLKKQAEEGTITANESIAEQQKISAERTLAKQKEQQLQQQLEDIKLLYQAVEHYMDKGDTIPVATGKAFLEVKGLKAIAGTLKGFYSGTKRTVGEELGSPVLPGKDGHIIRVDGSEKIFNPAQSMATGDATTDEIVDGFLFAKAMSNGLLNKINIGGKESNYDDRMIKKLDSLQKTIENKPEFEFDVNVLGKGIVELSSVKKTGNDLVFNRFIARS